MSLQPLTQTIRQISVEDFARLAADADQLSTIQLIDVREPEELELAQLDGFINLPLSEFPTWSGQIRSLLNPEVETIVMCHHGMRSAQMCYWLVNQGFTNVVNLAGGIDAYSVKVDPSISRY
jgi:rhodanese-related sulfurtransferase